MVDAADDSRNRNSLMKYSVAFFIKEMYHTDDPSYEMKSPLSQLWLEIHHMCFVVQTSC